MKKPGSVQYLRQLTDLIFKYDNKWREADESKIELPERDERKRSEHWKDIVELCRDIQADYGKPVRGRSPAAGEASGEKAGTTLGDQT